jgi:hypothetical protein
MQSRVRGEIYMKAMKRLVLTTITVAIFNGVTHKVNPAIDGEWEFVNQTLSETGLVSARGHVVPAHPLTTAKTATGGEFHSDGRILVLVLNSGDAGNQ